MGAATSEHESTEQMQDKGYSLAGSGSPDGSKRKHPARNTVHTDSTSCYRKTAILPLPQPQAKLKLI